MDTTENIVKAKEVEMVKLDEGKKSRFSLLVLIASVLSLGSLAWSTWSFIDLYQVDVVRIEKLGGLSLISLSAAATMDLVWSGTMIAQYQGQRLRKTIPFVKGGKDYDFLPLIGWAEALFVAALLGYHGSTIGGGAASFAAVLPVFTKLTWTLALNGLKDPFELTEDEKAMLAAKKRKSRLQREDTEATAEQHEAEMIGKQREHEAELEDLRRKNEVERERVRAEIERTKMERDAKFEEEQDKLEGENALKAMRQRLSARLQIENLRTQQEITVERLDAEQDLRLRRPLTIQGETVPALRAQAALPSGDEFGGLGLKETDLRQMRMAADYYAVDYKEGGVTKAAFCKVNEIHAPRLSEATRNFPVEWFVERGLADWQAEN